MKIVDLELEKAQYKNLTSSASADFFVFTHATIQFESSILQSIENLSTIEGIKGIPRILIYLWFGLYIHNKTHNIYSEHNKVHITIND